MNLQKYFNNDPLAPFYNLNEFKDVVLTCDVDWAPDYAIAEVLDLIAGYDFKANFFATHKSDLLLQKSEAVEVGIHPDFTRQNSKLTHEQRINDLLHLYPESKGTRSHRNFFGQNISDMAKAAGLKYDASVFLWNESFCNTHIDYNGMVRFSYMWEDGIHLDTNTPKDISKINLHTPGMKILNVHPILIYLNAETDDQRREVTKKYSDLTKASYKEVKKHVNAGYGIKDFYKEILKYLKSMNVRSHLLSDLAELRLSQKYQQRNVA
jgi:predicted heme/steroid binding protein